MDAYYLAFVPFRSFVNLTLAWNLIFSQINKTKKGGILAKENLQNLPLASFRCMYIIKFNNHQHLYFVFNIFFCEIMFSTNIFFLNIAIRLWFDDYDITLTI